MLSVSEGDSRIISVVEYMYTKHATHDTPTSWGV